MLKLFRAKDYQLELVDSGWLSDTMRSLRFKSAELFADQPMEDGEFLRFWFPKPGTQREFQRGYTLVNSWLGSIS